MKRSSLVRHAFVFGSLAAFSSAYAPRAEAGIPLYDKDGWSFSTDGRAQGFYSFANGDSAPKGGADAPGGGTWTYTGDGGFGAKGDGANTFTTSRVRGGWAASVFGVTVNRQINPDLKVTGRLSFWFAIEGDQAKGAANNVGSLDIRQGFLKLEGNWGGLLFGRNLGLHSRQAIIQNSIFSDEYGIGSPCNITGLGISCGQAGYGVMFPGFNPGIVYNTPDINGLTVTVGAYDPVRFDDQGWGQTPIPRMEFEATYKKAMFDVFANGMWQRLGKTGGSDTLDALGFGYGARAQFGALRLGFLGAFDKGGGMYIPLEPGSMPIDSAGQLRTVTTFWGQAMYSLGMYDITAGYGAALAKENAADADLRASMMTPSALIKSQVGINVGLLYHLDAVVLAAQFFRMQHTWYNDATQNANVVNLGATFNW